MTNRCDYKQRFLDTSPEIQAAIVDPYPPYAVSYKSMTVDVGEVVKGYRKLDLCHYNNFDLIPQIVTILLAKAKNKLMSSMIGDSTNKAIINFICSYGYATKSYNQNALHVAIRTYLPEVTAEKSYLNTCKGLYQVILVMVFLMTLYDACFMFQMDNSVTMMIETLQQFCLIPNLDNTSLLGTLSN